MSERKAEREYRRAGRPTRHRSAGLHSESGRRWIYTVSGFVLPGEWTLARTEDQSQERVVHRRSSDGTINGGGVVVRGGRGRLKSPPGSGWIGEWMEFFGLLGSTTGLVFVRLMLVVRDPTMEEWMEFFGLLGSTTGLEGLVFVRLMLVVRDPTMVVVGFVSPSKGVGNTASLIVGLAKLGLPLQLYISCF
ncbi:hypothetical protein L484_012897 [Morus notabilis]|uniref:Uncharacterized protein n=1 Tax=Morus notabilis TaxID=981085 RepID=W9RNJ4_9ROSA|nr:hypothetical protein L484_012897 [Morus notabilis]